MRSLLLVGMLLLMVSRAQTAQRPPAPIDACSLVTKAEVEAAVGAPVTEPQKRQEANQTNCEFGDAKAPVFTTRLWVSVTTGASASQAKAEHDMNRMFVAADLRPVSGVGDDAFWNSRVTALWVLRGKHQFSIHRAPNPETAKSLALKILHRLPSS
jgi:hypothetical protein